MVVTKGFPETDDDEVKSAPATLSAEAQEDTQAIDDRCACTCAKLAGYLC